MINSITNTFKQVYSDSNHFDIDMFEKESTSLSRLFNVFSFQSCQRIFGSCLDKKTIGTELAELSQVYFNSLLIAITKKEGKINVNGVCNIYI